MFYKSLMLPLLGQVLLTFVVMFTMYFRRIEEFKAKRIHPDSVKTRHEFRNRLTDSANSADNFLNLFEMPVLFYVAMLLAMTLLVSDALLVALAWLYVVLRVAHSVIHVTYNTVMHRFYVFAASALVLLVIWVRLASLILMK
jgi:hypothetical protein